MFLRSLKRFRVSLKGNSPWGGTMRIWGTAEILVPLRPGLRRYSIIRDNGYIRTKTGTFAPEKPVIPYIKAIAVK